MPPDIILPVIVVFIVIGLPVIGWTLVSLARILKGETKKGRGNERGSAEEAAFVQDISHSMDRLEKRIDALETLIFESRSNRHR